MNLTVIFAALLILTAVGYYSGRQRAVATVGGRASQLHSLPSYHGAYVALWCLLPALLLLVLWMLAEPHILQALTIGALPPELANLPDEPARAGPQ